MGSYYGPLIWNHSVLTIYHTPDTGPYFQPDWEPMLRGFAEPKGAVVGRWVSRIANVGRCVSMKAPEQSGEEGGGAEMWARSPNLPKRT